MSRFSIPNLLNPVNGNVLSRRNERFSPTNFLNNSMISQENQVNTSRINNEGRQTISTASTVEISNSPNVGESRGL